jgi:hypothetical protein
LDWDAAGNKLTVTPSLPADWDRAALRHVPLAGGSVDVEIKRSGAMLLVRASGSSDSVLLDSRAPGARFSGGILRIPLPAVEAGLAAALPKPGATTQQMKVLDQQSTGNSLLLRLSAPANSHQTIMLRVNDPQAKLHIDGAQMPQGSNSSLRPLQLDFGAGEGYVEKTLKVTW